MKQYVYTKIRHLLPVMALAVLLTVCGNGPQVVRQTATGSVLDIARWVVESSVHAADAAPMGSGQWIEGEMEIDVGEGPLKLISVAETISADLAEQARNPQERQILKGLAGQIEHESEGIRLGNSLHLDLNARGGGSGRSTNAIAMKLVLHAETLAFESGELTFHPAGFGFLKFYGCEEGCASPPEFTFERLEYNADGTLAIVGSFSVQTLHLISLGKNKDGASTLGPVQGRFSFEALKVI